MYDIGLNTLKDNPLPVFPSFYFIFYVWRRIVGVQRGADFISILILYYPHLYYSNLVIGSELVECSIMSYLHGILNYENLPPRTIGEMK